METTTKLEEVLKPFTGANGNESRLNSQFKNLANYFLLNGYFLINNQVKVYLRSIEFYYHEENGVIKDPITYHKNTTKHIVPYYPIGLMNMHQSGIDITFESEKEQYRASMLIRGFNIVNRTEDLTPLYESRSTYIYEAFFMQFPIQNKIQLEWVEEPLNYLGAKISSQKRLNVSLYNDAGKKIKAEEMPEYEPTQNKKYVQDQRKWRFTLELETKPL